MKQKDAVELLISCFFDGDTVAEAIAFIERCYWERPTDKAVEVAKAAIREQCNKEWR